MNKIGIESGWQLHFPSVTEIVHITNRVRVVRFLPTLGCRFVHADHFESTKTDMDVETRLWTDIKIGYRIRGRIHVGLGSLENADDVHFASRMG